MKQWLLCIIVFIKYELHMYVIINIITTVLIDGYILNLAGVNILREASQDDFVSNIPFTGTHW